jgi:hypothetical protein
VGGRFQNPFFHTEVIWDDDLNFDGVAATFRLPAQPGRTFDPFATVGWFPIRADNPPRSSRSLTGAQTRLQWDVNARPRTKFGAAQYFYQNEEGRVDPDYSAVFGPGRTYGQYEYGPRARQKGNSLFLTNNPLQIQEGLTPDKALWGLTAQFRPLAITAAAELSHFAPTYIGLSGEYVKNTAYDRSEILSRTGIELNDGRDYGWYVRAQIGSQSVQKLWDWQVVLSYRQLGSDAVLDGFADSDFGLGGTNNKGYTVGALLGIARNLDK